MKFRKKPVVIEAMQFLGPGIPVEPLLALEEWFVSGGGKGKFVGESMVIHTLEGDMRADPGDWIIKGVKGEFYPCKPDIFAATYEPADDAHLKEGGA